MIAAVVLTNLLYVVGAAVVATIVSALIVLRHRRPKSLEAGIELFSRELQALAPEHRAQTLRPEHLDGHGGTSGGGHDGGGQESSPLRGPPSPTTARRKSSSATSNGRSPLPPVRPGYSTSNEAGAALPSPEAEPG